MSLSLGKLSSPKNGKKGDNCPLWMTPPSPLPQWRIGRSDTLGKLVSACLVGGQPPSVGCPPLVGVQPGVEEPGGEEDGVGGRNLLVFLFGYQELWREASHWQLTTRGRTILLEHCISFTGFFLFICIVQQNE